MQQYPLHLLYQYHLHLLYQYHLHHKKDELTALTRHQRNYRVMVLTET